MKSKLLETGDGLLGPGDVGSSITANRREPHDAGVVVYNMEVEGTHTYFVRAEDSDAEPVWVHNATNYQSIEDGVPKYTGIADTGATRTLPRRLAAARARTPAARSGEIPGAAGSTTLESQQMEQALIHYYGREVVEAGGSLVNVYRGVNVSDPNIRAGYALLKKMVLPESQWV